MNTASWGPDGWKLLHSIAYCYTFEKNEEENQIYKRFFNAIQHLLPCVYCRRSYAKYMKEIPINGYLYTSSTHPKRNLFYHLYLIHNKVNAKLRNQGYNDKPDPSYKEVLIQYRSFVKKINCIVGWHFLYCMIFNYPEKGTDCSKRRKQAYINFFECLAYLLPCHRIREKYRVYVEKNPISECMGSREELKKWLHRLERKIRGEKCKPYKVRCETVEKCRVSKCDGQTCRK